MSTKVNIQELKIYLTLREFVLVSVVQQLCNGVNTLVSLWLHSVLGGAIIIGEGQTMNMGSPECANVDRHGVQVLTKQNPQLVVLLRQIVFVLPQSFSPQHSSVDAQHQ